jgi:NADH:ubiquinone reductase (H+-translocating)
MPQSNPRAVILGAGFGGLEATKTLRRAPVEIILIDRQNYHCFQPLLYQVATAALSPADIAWAIRHILRRQENATVFMADVTGIDAEARIVNTKAGPFSFDFLVIATGARNWYFGHDGWAEVAPGLKRIEDATRIRRNILSAFEDAELARDDAERMRLLTFVIIGGGPTGVEMAGAIAEVARQTLARDFRRIDPRTAVDERPSCSAKMRRGGSARKSQRKGQAVPIRRRNRQCRSQSSLRNYWTRVA